MPMLYIGKALIDEQSELPTLLPCVPCAPPARGTGTLGEVPLWVCWLLPLVAVGGAAVAGSTTDPVA